MKFTTKKINPNHSGFVDVEFDHQEQSVVLYERTEDYGVDVFEWGFDEPISRAVDVELKGNMHDKITSVFGIYDTESFIN